MWHNVRKLVLSGHQEMAGSEHLKEQLKEFDTGDGTPRFSPFFIPKIIVDIAAGVIFHPEQITWP